MTEASEKGTDIDSILTVNARENASDGVVIIKNLYKGFSGAQPAFKKKIQTALKQFKLGRGLQAIADVNVRAWLTGMQQQV